jgi:hypothetical protein
MKGLEQLAGVFGLGSVELDKFIGVQVEAAVQTAATSPAAPVASPVIAGQPAA